jgi:hypothetical protein
MGQGRPLSEVLSDILTLQGAILEKRGEQVEFLCPPSLSETLNIPEHGMLSFTYHPPYEEVISATYESELFRAIEKLFSEKGKMAVATYPSHLPNIEKLSKKISEKVILSNATFRLKKVEIQKINYVLCFFKYMAISDEKREGFFSVLVNELNLSSSPSAESLRDFMNDLKEPDPELTKPRKESIKALLSGLSSSSIFVEEELGQFIKSLERRLNRDIKRVVDYYETLKLETQKVFDKKSFSGDKEFEMEMKDETLKKQEGEKLLEKLNAIESEKRWKIQDLISKYAISVQMEPVCTILIETESPVFWIDIRRRLSSRSFPLTYNPMLKKMDPLPCEACFYPRGGYYICDEKLHLLCSSCFKICGECGKPYCSACHKSGCPKCNVYKDKPITKQKEIELSPHERV